MRNTPQRHRDTEEETREGLVMNACSRRALHSALSSVSLCLCGALLSCLSTNTRASTQVPGKPQEAPVLLVGGDVYTVSGDVIAGGQVLFDKGKIVVVGKDLKAPEGVKRIDISGKRVYPGLLSAGTDLGLAEI